MGKKFRLYAQSQPCCQRDKMGKKPGSLLRLPGWFSSSKDIGQGRKLPAVQILEGKYCLAGLDLEIRLPS